MFLNATQDLIIVKGTDFVTQMRFRISEGVYVDITDNTYTSEIRDKSNELVATFDITKIDDNYLQLSLDKEVTADLSGVGLKYDLIQVSDIETRLLNGYVTLENKVTE